MLDFWGKGVGLTRWGKRRLKIIFRFICLVTVFRLTYCVWAKLESTLRGHVRINTFDWANISFILNYLVVEQLLVYRSLDKSVIFFLSTPRSFFCVPGFFGDCHGSDILCFISFHLLFLFCRIIWLHCLGFDFENLPLSFDFLILIRFCLSNLRIFLIIFSFVFFTMLWDALIFTFFYEVMTWSSRSVHHRSITRVRIMSR
jgi:hypothetical protein